jgi:hypothetical protein
MAVMLESKPVNERLGWSLKWIRRYYDQGPGIRKCSLCDQRIERLQRHLRIRVPGKYGPNNVNICGYCIRAAHKCLEET